MLIVHSLSLSQSFPEEERSDMGFDELESGSRARMGRGEEWHPQRHGLRSLKLDLGTVPGSVDPERGLSTVGPGAVTSQNKDGV